MTGGHIRQTADFGLSETALSHGERAAAAESSPYHYQYNDMMYSGQAWVLLRRIHKYTNWDALLTFRWRLWKTNWENTTTRARHLISDGRILSMSGHPP